MRIRLTSLLALTLLVCCTLPAQPDRRTPGKPADALESGTTIHLGIDVLKARGFPHMAGKRVGLLTHPAGVNRRGQSTIEVLRHAPQVNLVALFGPEHGIYGDERANVPIQDRTDPRTGLPVFSLYGATRRPTRQMLERIDLLVIDLQDLGVRSYTYASAMRYAMEECFRYGVEVMVLDRPNPIGGRKVDGPPLDERWMSYVGAFRVPYVHGLTIGELARIAHAVPGWMEIEDATRSRGVLHVIPMRGWNRSMMWPDTGLSWVPTSPSIPDLSAAMGYAMTGLGTQLGGFRHGFGTRYPFRMLQYSGRSPEEIKRALRQREIPGLDYKIVRWTASDGRRHRGVYVIVTDWNTVRPTEISFHMMQIAAEWNPGRRNPFAAATSAEADLFNKHVGSTEWWNALTTQGARVPVRSFVERWQYAAQEFREWSRQFWLYPER